MGRADWGDDDDFEDTSLRDSGTVVAQVHRINGPPGTGKTTWLARQCNLAAEKYGGSAVVVASLTRAAAAEVAGRKTEVPRKNVGTLHSHAYQALGRPVIAETSEGLASWNEYAPSTNMRISNKHAVDPENALPEPAMIDTTGAEMLQLMGVYRARMTPRELWSPRVARFAAKWDEWKAKSGYMDFTDLIEAAIARVPKHPAAPKVMMLDEAQDMSKLDMTLALKWGRQAETLLVVGDADQNLYQWRGSDPEAFTGLPADTIRTLSQSWRVPVAVHEVAVGLVGRIDDRELVEYQARAADPREPDGARAAGAASLSPHAWRTPEKLARDLEERLGETVRRVTLDEHGEWVEVDDPVTIMVLASCGYMLGPLIQELRKLGVPFHNPYRTTQGAWNPLRAGRRLLAYMRPLRDVWGDEARMWTWKDVKTFTDIMQSRGVMMRGAKSQIASRLVEDMFGDSHGDEEVDLDTFGRLFEESVWDQLMAYDLTWWESTLKHAERPRQQYPLTIARRHGAARLLDAPRLCLGTIHSVKGGESDIVYVFPDLSSVGYETHRKGNQDPTWRQFYVAVTRAREEIVMCKASDQGAIKWPS